MSKRKRRTIPREVDALLVRVVRWRKQRQKRSPMPEDLWQDAARLATTHGIHPVAQTAGLNYENLKRRVAQRRQAGPDEEAGPGEFVELSAAQLLGQSSGTRKVELSAVDGNGMTVHLAAGDALDVVALAQAFWSRTR